MERISIVKSFVCPCSFSRDDDSSFLARRRRVRGSFFRARRVEGGLLFVLCVCMRAYVVVFTNSLSNFWNSLTKL